MKLPFSVAESLIAMQKGEKIPLSQVKSPVVETMIENGILKKQIQGRTRLLIYLTDVNRLFLYLENDFGIKNLEEYVAVLRQMDLNRAEAIDIASNSKIKRIRTFKGFLVNCFQPLECVLKSEKFILQPCEGTFVFMCDFEHFYPSSSATVVGVENPENF